MKALRFLVLVGLLSGVASPAYAHGNGIIVIVLMAAAPVLLLLFLPIWLLSGMQGHRWYAFGLYLVAIAALGFCQTQSWYHPFAGLFPDPDRLSSILPEFILVPPLDMVVLLELWVIVIYLILRDRRVPFGFVSFLPLKNVILGSAFAIGAAILWAYVLFGPVGSSARMWPDGVRIPLLIIWVFIVPIVLVFTGIGLFKDGAIRLPRVSGRSDSDTP